MPAAQGSNVSWRRIVGADAGMGGGEPEGAGDPDAGGPADGPGADEASQPWA